MAVTYRRRCEEERKPRRVFHVRTGSKVSEEEQRRNDTNRKSN